MLFLAINQKTGRRKGGKRAEDLLWGNTKTALLVRKRITVIGNYIFTVAS